MRHFRRRLIRLLAALLIWAVPAAPLEAAIGAERDASIHHESARQAASHPSNPAGEHGHEDDLPALQHQHGPVHKHGTTADHCRHLHHYGLTASPLVSFAGFARGSIAREVERATEWFRPTELPPPRH